MDPYEVKLIRQYAINEVAGGMLLGRFLLGSANPLVRSKLTYHAYDEFRHGWLWTEFLDKRGIGVEPAEGENLYFNFAGTLKDEIDFLAAVHIYELRVPFHLSLHMEVPQIDPELKVLMGEIRDDEKFHLGWIRKYLTEKLATDAEHVLAAVKAAEKAEEETYVGYIRHIKQYGGYFADLANIVEANLSTFPAPSATFEAAAHG